MESPLVRGALVSQGVGEQGAIHHVGGGVEQVAMRVESVVHKPQLVGIADDARRTQGVVDAANAHVSCEEGCVE